MIGFCADRDENSTIRELDSFCHTMEYLGAVVDRTDDDVVNLRGVVVRGERCDVSFRWRSFHGAWWRGAIVGSGVIGSVSRRNVYLGLERPDSVEDVCSDVYDAGGMTDRYRWHFSGLVWLRNVEYVDGLKPGSITQVHRVMMGKNFSNSC